MSTWVIGVDLGATKVELGLVGPDDRIAARRRFPTQAHLGAESVVARIGEAVDELARALPAGAAIAGLGICSPGPVDHEAGVLLDPPNIQGLHHAPLRRMLADRLGVPVVLEHDAKAAALGDYYFGAGKGARSMVFVVVGTGVGAAIIVDGQLFRGGHNSAGEIGHTTLDPHGELCSCGNRGCVETFMSGPRLAQRYLRRAPEAGEGVTGEQVAQRATQGDVAAQGVMAEAGEALGTAVATMAMLMDVDLYVVGGSVAKAGDLVLEPARHAVPRHSFVSVAERVHILPTALGDDGPILGCAWLARQLVGA
jgi:glucokinase